MEAAELKTEFGGLLFLLLVALFTTYIAKRKGFYRFPHPPAYYPISFGSVFGIFTVYVGTAFLLFPLLYLLIGYIATGSLKSLKALPKETQSWIQVSSIYLLFFMVVGFAFLVRKKGVDSILWGQEQERTPRKALRHFGMGVLTWLVSYPVVLFISAVAGVISVYLFGKRGVEQEAVKIIKDTLNYPWRLFILILGVVVLVPILEELLFRGFLQTWLRGKIGRTWALIVTAFTFAIVHYSYSQGTGNFELLISLFVLSCYLGFIYERQTTLFAPIGLHMAFNGFTVIGILIAAFK